MKLQTVPARRGALWVQQGFRTFFKQPLAFAALFAVFMFGVLLLALVPMIGPFMVLALLGLPHVVAYPQVLVAMLPQHALAFIVAHPGIAFVALGGIGRDVVQALFVRGVFGDAWAATPVAGYAAIYAIEIVLLCATVAAMAALLRSHPAPSNTLNNQPRHQWSAS